MGCSASYCQTNQTSIPVKHRKVPSDIHFIWDKVAGAVIVLREPSDNEVRETIP